MAKRLYSREQVKAALLQRCEGMSIADIAKEVGISAPTVHNMRAGAPVTGSVLAWLGFKKADPMYVKIERVDSRPYHKSQREAIKAMRALAKKEKVS